MSMFGAKHLRERGASPTVREGPGKARPYPGIHLMILNTSSTLSENPNDSGADCCLFLHLRS